jgi:hypothetical protein
VQLERDRLAADHANIDVLLEQVGGEAVPQHMYGHRPVDFGHVGGDMQAQLS